MGIEDLLNGEELIIKQNSIIKELPSKGSKEFCPDNSWIEKKQIEKKLEEKFNFIKTGRIEKSNNISLAKWIPQLGKAKVLKKVGKPWETIGHHQDNADWLLPEEVLFLVENCELQLILDNVCASIEDCYALLLHDECCTLDEYRVYSYLSRAGFRVVRHAPSITVTPYEQKVNLDLILQRCRRSPPCTSGVILNLNEENEVTIINEDVNILSKYEKKTETVLHNIKQDVDLIEVIEIDDDVDPKPIIEEVLDSSDDSSDIICISSPSYISTDQCRLWYPTVHKSLLRSFEKVIDLCNEDSPNDFKELIHNRLDLIKASRAEILAHLPSAENGVSVIESPDSRLLPNNIVPKYSEYKVNLNVRSDYCASNNFNLDHLSAPRIPLTNMMTSAQISPDFINSPFFRRAGEMQAMAMNMIQTATTLMSVLSSQNPNELWNLVESRNQDILPFHPTFSVLQQQRPYYHFPRRNYRNMRRRNHYEKRGGSNRYFRKSYQSNKMSSIIDVPSANVDCSSEIKMEVVVLSDDEESINRTDYLPPDLNSGKRKINSDVGFKKLKSENAHDSSILLEETSNNLKKSLSLDIKRKYENVKTIEIIENGKNIMKEKSVNAFHHSSIGDPVNETQAEMECEDNSSQTVLILQVNSETENVEIETCLEKKSKPQEPSNDFELEINSLIDEVTDNIVENEQSVNQEKIIVSDTEKKCVQNFVDNSDMNIRSSNVDSLKGNELKSSSSKSINESSSCSKREFRLVNASSGKVTCWEEYKHTNDSDFGAEEEFIGDPDSLLKLEECINYGDILTTLQIFNEADVTKGRKPFKITFDVYLPEINFKKSLKVLPNFRVIVSKSCEELPTPADLKFLKIEYKDQIPFLFSVVFNETVGFYLYDTTSLPPYFE